MQTPRKNRRKYLWYAAAFIVIITAVVFYNSNKYSFINNKLDDIVESETDNLYKIAYDSISVNEVEGDLYIHNLSIKGDTALQLKYMKENNPAAANMLLDIFVPSLKVVGFETSKALLNKQMTCDRIIITGPRVIAYVFPGQAKDADIKKQGQELYKQILGKFTLIKSDSVSVISSEVVMMDFKSKENKFQVYNTSINLIDLLIDSTHNDDTTRTLFCKEISLHTDKVVVGDKNASSQASNLTFDTRNKILAISNIAHDGVKSGGPFGGNADDITITGIEATGAIESLNIVIGKASFKKAAIQLKSKKDKPEKESIDNRLLTGWVKSFKMNELHAGNISLKVISNKNKQNDISINNSAVKIKDLLLDTNSRMDQSLIKEAAEINISNDLITFKSADELYLYKVAGLQLNTLQKIIKVREFSINPRLNEAAFARKAKVQRDRYNISLNNMLCSVVNFDDLLQDRIDIESVRFSNSFIKVYRDISYPLDSIKKVGNHPHQMINKLKTPIKIGKFTGSNTLIEYKEKNGMSDTSGAVRFEKSTITITNITNTPIPANNKMDLVFETLLSGQIPMKTVIKFDLTNINMGNYQVTGAINKPFEGKVLNPVIIPMGLVRIDKGTINELDFSFTGSNSNAQGVVQMKYNNLKLSLLKKDKNKNKINRKSITSLLANVLVINNNPSNNKLRQANVNYRRDDYKSFFNMMWKFIFEGMKDVIGVKL